MDNFPVPIQQAVYKFLLGDRPLAYLQLDPQGLLESHAGDLKIFGLENLQPELALDRQVDFLTGLLDLNALPLDLPFIELPSGMPTRVQIFEQGNRIWILLIAVDDTHRQQQVVQQKVNDLRLTHRRHSQILNQYLGKEVARRLDIGIDSVDHRGERRNLTTMFADIRGFTSFSEKSLPEDVFEVLNIYLGTMITEVIAEQGVIDKIIGDEVMAIFGMLPGQNEGADDGLRASIQMLSAIEGLNRWREKNRQTLLQVGIGIATGPVSLGVLGSQDRKSITVVGNHVNLAARLQSLAGPNQIAIDRSTYDATTRFKEHFSRREVALKGFSEAIEVYLLQLEKVRDPGQPAVR